MAGLDLEGQRVFFFFFFSWRSLTGQNDFFKKHKRRNCKGSMSCAKEILSFPAHILLFKKLFILNNFRTTEIFSIFNHILQMLKSYMTTYISKSRN